jgi:hypothetical protein
MFLRFGRSGRPGESSDLKEIILGIAPARSASPLTHQSQPSVTGNEPLILIVGETQACQSIRDVGQSQGIAGLEKRKPRPADGFADADTH